MKFIGLNERSSADSFVLQGEKAKNRGEKEEFSIYILVILRWWTRQTDRQGRECNQQFFFLQAVNSLCETIIDLGKVFDVVNHG